MGNHYKQTPFKIKGLLLSLLLILFTYPMSAQTDVKFEHQNQLHYFHNTHFDIINSIVNDITKEAPLTIFLPSIEAFNNLSPEQKKLYFSHPYTELIELLKSHMVSGVYTLNNLMDGMQLKTITGTNLYVKKTKDAVYINGAKISLADFRLFKSVFHIVDKVIIPGYTVYDIIKNSEVHNTLEAAIIAAKLDKTLQGEGPFTVFAPTDAAFKALPEGTVEALLNDPEGQLKQILLYHVVAGRGMSSDLINGDMIITLQGKPVKITIKDGHIYINNAKVTVADLKADNGVVHVIDAVLLTPTNTIYDIVSNSPDHTILKAAVDAAMLAPALKGNEVFTLFAPTDNAFKALPEGTVEALLEDPEGQLRQILLYHVVEGKALSSDLSDGQWIITLQGKKVKVSIMDGHVYINNAKVTVADLVADNGVVHVIDAVLLPPTNTIYDIVSNSPDHTILKAAVDAAMLAPALKGSEVFTLFAPTDDAFKALPEGTVEALLEDPEGQLKQILLYHVAEGKALSSDLSDGQWIMTLQGKKVKVTIEDGHAYINNAKVTVADLVADNGVVHVINAVLLPPTKTIYDIVSNSPDHTILKAAVDAAMLEPALKGNEVFTLFAPTDDAFKALPEGTVEALLEDPTGQLRQILLYHVVEGKALSSDLSDGQWIMTLQGKKVKVSFMDGHVYINNAKVTVADLVADNGVVHVINAVLLPPTNTIYDIVSNSPDHTILKAAVDAAMLAPALKGSEVFTLFAPTDDAFKALPEGTVEAQLEDPTGQLKQILLYHVVEGKALSSDLSDGQWIMTLQGKKVKVSFMDGHVYINNAKVTVADLVADNGVVHVINAVLLPPTNTIYDIVSNSPDHTILKAAVDAAMLAPALKGNEVFTLFAPTDNAFKALPEGTVEALLEDPEGQLRQILLYHVVEGKALSSDLSDGQWIMTLQGKKVKVTIEDGHVYINNAKVTVADLVADNGVVHVIDAVLLPPTNTIYDIVSNSPDHTILKAAVDAAMLTPALKGKEVFTLFAPTDDAFKALPEGTVEALLEDPTGQLRQILLYHVVEGKALSSDLSDGQWIMTLQGKKVKVTIEDGHVYINNAKVTVADLVAGNGVVHVINAVLLPPTNTIYDIVSNSPDHTILKAAVDAAMLTPALKGKEVFTLFAPTDDAFKALPEGTVEALLEDPTGQLKQILLYHVVEGKALSGDLSDGQWIMTLQGKKVKVTIEDGHVYINNAKVTVADLVADNGVVHVINAVLLPPTNTIYDIVSNSADHTILKAAVDAAKLDGALKGEGMLTLFAPTDDAFKALPEGTVEALLEDPEGQLKQILLYHVAEGKALSSDLSDGQWIMTLQGKKVKVSIMDGHVYINNAKVTVADLKADNGVVHVINAVLLPPTNTIYDIVSNSADHTILKAAVDAAKLDGALKGEGMLTLFAPTDDAFKALPEGTVEALLEDPEGQLKQILLYHVAEGKALSSDLSDGQWIMTLQGKKVKVSIMDGHVYINNAKVTVADLKADNGVVHVINAVLLPPTNTIYDIVSNSADHTILKAAVDAAKLDAALKCEDLLTLFAPTDDAFRALPKGTVEALLEDPTGQLKQILLYHVVEGKTLSNELSDGQTIMTLQGQKVQVSIKNGHVYINNAKVTVADVMADNGVVHVINAVLLPPTNTIYDIVSNSADHTILKAAVDAAKLDATLKGEDLLTLFAPTDDAFRALPKGTVEALLEDPTGQLKQILLYHVVEGKTLSNELSDGQTIMTLQGQKVQVSIKNGHVYINNAKVTVADVMADNGVVHVINAVLDDQARMILSVNSFDLLSFNLSPNPAASSTRIILDNIYSGTMTLFVYNSLGKQVITKRINDPKDIILDVSDLQKGIYFVVLESNGTKKTRKLLVK